MFSHDGVLLWPQPGTDNCQRLRSVWLGSSQFISAPTQASADRQTRPTPLSATHQFISLLKSIICNVKSWEIYAFFFLHCVGVLLHLYCSLGKIFTYPDSITGCQSTSLTNCCLHAKETHVQRHENTDLEIAMILNLLNIRFYLSIRFSNFLTTLAKFIIVVLLKSITNLLSTA